MARGPARWSGRSLWADSKTESGIHPVLRRPDRWAGLPPIPTWWTWLGEPYREFAHLLPAHLRTTTTTGALFEASPVPVDRDHLEPPYHWLPSDLFATPALDTEGFRPRPLVPAGTIPPYLA